MKKCTLILCLTGIFYKVNAQQYTKAEEAHVDSLIKEMTLDEKVGEMTQLTLNAVSKDGIHVDAEMLKKAIVQYHVGSVLNVTEHAISLSEWQHLITEIQAETQNTRLKIPVLYGLDAIHGQTYTLNATLFPQNIAMAASRNPDLVKAAGKITAAELRASGVRWNFAPVLDVGRQPLWSRFPETYGEDVLLTTTLGSAAINGYQEDGLKNITAVAACMKHFIGYSASRTGKDRTPIYLPEIELREYYLPPFREAVRVGVASVMINSSEINGTPVHASRYLLTDVLRKELGFQGVAVSDWEDVIRLHTIHKVAASPREAVAMAVNAGIDMSMVPYDYSFPELLKEAVKQKEVPVSRINEAVKRILLMKMELGLFDNPYPEKKAAENFGLSRYGIVALQAARESMTLLKNKDNILPLQKNKKILIAGPAAQSITALNGCWSYTWQGDKEQWYPSGSQTIVQAFTGKVGAGHIIFSGNKAFDDAANYNTSRLREDAAMADIIVLCLGENAYAESPGNITDLALPVNQVELANAAFETGKPVVIILTEGRPRFITDIEPKAGGILMAYWSGSKTAAAIADVIYGDYNPSGILPFSYPKSMGEMVLYDRKATEDKREIFNENVRWDGYDPLYPFGWGLSYTTFKYDQLKLNKTTIKGDEQLEISVTVTNTGNREGMHTVELYTNDLYASITPSVKRLRAFQKVTLGKGESKALKFLIGKKDLAFVNEQLQTVTEPGTFNILVGDLKASFNYEL